MKEEKLKPLITVSCLDCGEYFNAKSKRKLYCDHCLEQRKKIYKSWNRRAVGKGGKMKYINCSRQSECTLNCPMNDGCTFFKPCQQPVEGEEINYKQNCNLTKKACMQFGHGLINENCYDCGRADALREAVVTIKLVDVRDDDSLSTYFNKIIAAIQSLPVKIK